MKKLLWLLVIPLLASCTLAEMTNWGYWKARDPATRQSITVDTHDNFGWDWVAMMAPINQTAGWDLIVPASWKGVPNNQADITFQQMSPIIDGNGQAHQMWAPQYPCNVNQTCAPFNQAVFNPQFVGKCIIFWDPNWWLAAPWDFAADVITHEIYHCFGGYNHVPGVPGQTTDYAGAMGNYLFQDQNWRNVAWWNRQPYGASDRATLVNSGYAL